VKIGLYLKQIVTFLAENFLRWILMLKQTLKLSQLRSNSQVLN